MLSRILPAPKYNYNDHNNDQEESQPSDTNERKKIPAYPNRHNFVPTAPDDYGDGGAYPEIHIVQYPLNMGKPGVQKSTAVVPVQVDESGKLRTDVIVLQGSKSNKLIQSRISDIKEKAVDKDTTALPEESEVLETAERTKQALESLIGGKIKNSKGVEVQNVKEAAEPTFIRYNPNPSAPGYTSSAKQRVIKMVEAQVDPMEPPKHKLSKAPRGPPSPPVPVLHSPPRKLTVEDQQAWKIPPCVSNWKNARGFIIPLDKRVAADGRSMQEVTINNKFAMVSEALFIAERKATEDLKMRNDIRKKIALKEKEEREQSLRDMANRARMERAGIRQPDESAEFTGSRNEELVNDQEAMHRRKERFMADRTAEVLETASDSEAEDIEGFAGETEDEKIARQQRERIRMERRRERERELRMENMKGNMRKNKADRDDGRDISEKIALGMLKGTGGKLTGESLYDSRLFNQSAGMDAGFGAEDEYNTYSRPLFDRGEAGSIYRPRAGADDVYGNADEQLAKLSDTSRFKADKGFKGADGRSSAGPRNAPVQFERDAGNDAEKDPFGIEDIVDKRGNGRSGHDQQERKRSRKD